jgi:hypothetical protein
MVADLRRSPHAFLGVALEAETVQMGFDALAKEQRVLVGVGQEKEIVHVGEEPCTAPSSVPKKPF